MAIVFPGAKSPDLYHDAGPFAPTLQRSGFAYHEWVRRIATEAAGGNIMLVHHSNPSGGLAFAIAPILFLVIDVALVLYFIKDLYKPERRVYGGDKTLWLVILLFGSVIGMMAYLLFGRQE